MLVAAGTVTAAEASGGCAVTRTADSMPFDAAALVMTVRVRNGVVEVLHDVACDWGPGGTVWLRAALR